MNPGDAPRADPVNQTAAGAIVLAGGRGQRLGGVDKGALDVGGRSLLDRALTAVGAVPTVVVGPPRPLPPGVLAASEDPPGGGPAAGVVAGLAALESRLCADAPRGQIPDQALLLVLAVDHPGVTAETFSRLVSALRAGGGHGGALLVHDDRRQCGVGVYSVGALRAGIRQRASWHGVALRSLLSALADVEVPAIGAEADDIDTADDLQRWRGGSAGPVNDRGR